MLLTGVDQGGGGPSGKEKFEERTQRITHRLAIPVAHLVPRRNWVYTAHVNRGRGLTSIRSSCNRPAVPGQDEEITRWAILRLLLQEIKTFTDQTTATTDYTWDAAGNMLSKINLSGNTTYAWNYDNRLMSVTDPNNQVTAYGYDPFGIRVRMTDGNGTKRFLYSKEDIIGEFDGANTQTAYYVHGPLTDEPLGQIINGTLSFMHRDGLGSVTAFSSTTGQLAGTNNYYAFGKVSAQTGTTSRYGYTSRELDGNGLMYYRSRYYQPEVGRFLNQDFYKGDALVPPSLHRYVYTHNNPVNHADPEGNWTYYSSVTALTDAIYIGITFLDIELYKGPCESIPQPYIRINALAFGVGFGIAGSGSTGKAFFVDDKDLVSNGYDTEPYNLNKFDDVLFVIYAAAGIGLGLTRSIQVIRVGDSEAQSIFSLSHGFDASIFVGIGLSWAIEMGEKKCY